MRPGRRRGGRGRFSGLTRPRPHRYLGPHVNRLRVLCLVFLGSCEFYYRPDPGPGAGVMPEASRAESAKFRSIAEAFIAWTYAVSPTRATFDGIHDYDSRLGVYSRTRIEGQMDSLRQNLRRLSLVDRAALDDESYYDCLVLDSQIRASLLELELVRSWERNPNFYREIISGGLYALSALAFAPPERRMALAADRLLDVPEVLAQARLNLAGPPRIYVETGIDEFGGTHRFLKTALPAAFAPVTDPALRKRFVEAQKPALEAIEQFIDWMRKDLMGRAVDSFAIGEQAFCGKLRYEEMVETPLETLLSRGYELLKETQEGLRLLAGEKSLRALLKEAGREHPAADRLLGDTRAMLADLRAWAGTVVDIPAEADCTVQETPEFRRSLSFASMEIPGPFEKVARDAYYSITLPDPAWPSDRQEQHLAFFNRFSLPLISVHEAYPGHYAQFLAVQKCRSSVRKVFGCGSFSEGWAHYCEQLYVESQEHPDPRLRLQQLHMALLRICRYIAGIQMHTRGWTYEQAVEFFVAEGFQERLNAEREARRGTMDPTYLVYTLGKMEILKLREEYRRQTGRSLREFHNEFIRHGYPPIRIARMILLGKRE
jgi:uncharacterized protein (DUF885 family)